MQALRVPKMLLLMSALMIAALIVLIWTNIFDLKHLGALLQEAHPAWLLLALVFQAVTYLCVALIWYVVCVYGKEKVSLRGLARLAVEKFAIDQLLHVGGVAGRVAALEIMQRMGISAALAIEALIIDTVSYYAGYALIALAVLILILHYHVLFVVPTLIVLFILAMTVIIYGVYWLVNHRDWQPPRWLSRKVMVQNIREGLDEISMDRVRSGELLSVTTLFQISILVLDALTLWASLEALGIHASFFMAFMAFSLASIGALISLLPGGIGSFEAANTAALALLGVPFEAALAATLLLRFFSLWLPLIPGFFLAHKDLLSGRETMLAKNG